MTKEFFKCASLRAIRTMAQTALGIIGTGTLMSDVNWTMVLSASALAGILSVLTSIATGLPEVTYAQNEYMSKPEPEDSYTNEIAIPESGDDDED